MEVGHDFWLSLSRIEFIIVSAILFTSYPVCCSAGQASGEQLYSLKEVKEYENYANIALFRFRFPHHVTHAKWYINKVINPQDCPDVDFHVAIEAGSLPIINPYNTSFPENTRLPPTGTALTFAIPKGSQSMILDTSRVIPGDWFVIVYREKQNNKIKQAGLSKTCRYYSQAIAIYDKLTSIETLSSSGSTALKMDTSFSSTLYKVLVESNTAAFTIDVADCAAWSGNKSLGGHCPIQLSMEMQRIPDADSHTTSCLRNSSLFAGCSLHVKHASRGGWYYLNVSKDERDEQLRVDLNLTINVTVCQEPLSVAIPEPEDTDETHPPPNPLTADSPFSSSLLTTAIDLDELRESATVINEFIFESTTAYELNMTTTAATPTSPAPPPQDLSLCPRIEYWYTNYLSGSISKEFFPPLANSTEMYSAKSGVPYMAAFSLAVDDIGGVLILESALPLDAPQVDQDVTSVICMRKDRPPLWDGTALKCSEEMTYTGDVSSNDLITFNYPFPSAGTWYLGLYAVCHEINSKQQVPCSANVSLEVTVRLTSCVDGCGDHGRCERHTQAGILIYSCRCSDGYIGWGCTDDSQVSTNFLLQVLLLTLSNLVFLLDAGICLYRRHFPEAVSFLATCFFSTMYHACDSSPVCITDYDTLQFCDFFASFMSILLILISMARLPLSLKSLLHIVGVYVLAFFAQWNRFSLWSIAVPLGAGILILAVSWGIKMYKRRKLYPSLKRWLLFIVPGTVLAILGLSVNAALETDENYFIVHSAWHVCMGLGVLFLIPPREHKTKDNEFGPLIWRSTAGDNGSENGVSSARL